MLPSSKRLSVVLFSEVLATGEIFHSPLFTARILRNKNVFRFSAAVSKKIAKTAVERNKLRRRIYSAVKILEPKLKGGSHVLLMAKAPLTKASHKALVSDLESLFVKSRLIK